MTKEPKKTVVIIGAGFAGLNAAKSLGRCRAVSVVVIDRHNYHLFQPLLYQVATAALNPAEIAEPIRALLAKFPYTEVKLGSVERVELREKRVSGDFGSCSFDYLIMACGAQQHYFGHEGWEEHAPSLKTLEEATEIRRRILLAFERAEMSQDPREQEQLLTFVIVGGGPTGVELAGAIAEIARYTLVHDFKNIDPTTTRIILVEAAPRILTSFAPELAERASKDLAHLGVQVWTGCQVTDVTAEGARLGAEFLPTATVIWAAGVQAVSLAASVALVRDKQGRLIVSTDLSLPGFPSVFVVGDQAHCKNAAGEPLPGLASVAIQQGLFAAKAIQADLQGKERGVFCYRDKGQLATIGRNKALLQLGKVKAGGFIAWLVWLFVHLYYLIGFENKVLVLLQWGWSYCTFRRAARLIIGPESRRSRFRASD